MSTQPSSLLTPEQYLEIERKAEYKSEYLAGEMFAMAGASRAHNGLTVNLTVLLHPQVRKSGCRLYANNMRVRVIRPDLYTYPDIVVVRGESQFMDKSVDTLLNPTFLAEVLSPSTEAYDRGRKFEYYGTIESLKEYLLIAQDYINTELYTRQPDGNWLLKRASRPEDTLDLQSIGSQIKMADLYEDIFLSTPVIAE